MATTKNGKYGRCTVVENVNSSRSTRALSINFEETMCNVASDRKIYMYIYIYFIKRSIYFIKQESIVRVEILKGSRNRVSFSSFLRRRRKKKENRILKSI